MANNCIAFFQFTLKYRLLIFCHDKNAQRYEFIALFTLDNDFFLKKDTPYLALGPWTNETLDQIVIFIISSVMICFRFDSKSVNATRAVFNLGKLYDLHMRVLFENAGE